MTLNEAVIIAQICSKADHGCSHCVADLRDELTKAFPTFEWTARPQGIVVREIMHVSDYDNCQICTQCGAFYDMRDYDEIPWKDEP